MKIAIQTFLVFIALLILPLALFAQVKSISSENYYAALKEAEAKTKKQIRKKVQIQKLYTTGNVKHALIDTTEYLPPDKSRWINAEEKEGKIIVNIEQITIGNSIYRKEGNGAWVKQEIDGYGLGITGTDNSTREFFIEETKIGKEKFQVLTEKQVNYNQTFFDERTTWINEKGLITRSASTTSKYELKNIVSMVEVTYDYTIKPPKIESPIK